MTFTKASTSLIFGLGLALSAGSAFAGGVGNTGNSNNNPAVIQNDAMRRPRRPPWASRRTRWAPRRIVA